MNTCGYMGNVDIYTMWIYVECGYMWNVNNLFDVGICGMWIYIECGDM